MPASLTGSGLAAHAKPDKQAPNKPHPRWQTAGLHPECYNPRRQNRSLEATDAFYKVLGSLWLLSVVVFYIYMVAVVR
jgi:hypothetical protein